MSIEGNDVDNDDECPYLDSQFGVTEDEKSTNAPFRPGCRADRARVRNLVRRRQHPGRVPSITWLERGEEIATIRRDASRVVLPLLMRQGEPKRRRRGGQQAHP